MALKNGRDIIKGNECPRCNSGLRGEHVRASIAYDDLPFGPVSWFCDECPFEIPYWQKDSVFVVN